MIMNRAHGIRAIAGALVLLALRQNNHDVD